MRHSAELQAIERNQELIHVHLSDALDKKSLGGVGVGGWWWWGGLRGSGHTQLEHEHVQRDSNLEVKGTANTMGQGWHGRAKRCIQGPTEGVGETLYVICLTSMGLLCVCRSMAMAMMSEKQKKKRQNPWSLYLSHDASESKLCTAKEEVRGHFV